MGPSKTVRAAAGVTSLTLTLIACQPERPPGWTEATHGDSAPPAYAIVFDDTVVHRFDIAIEPAVYQAMLDDLAARIAAGTLAFDGSGEEPMWAAVTIGYDGLLWWHVAMRFKGNSLLVAAWNRGVRKLGFRLDFDKFEDDYPEIRNQRFHGFRELTFSNAFNDSSLVRDKVAADLFRAAGVPAARGAFAAVHLSVGGAPIYAGLFTTIEDPSDAMLGSQLGAGGANLYKPEGDGAAWTRFVASSFENRTNEGASPTDVETAMTALHASRADAAAWRDGLERTFDVALFLRALAVGQTMVNWDGYGCIAHNYYLYGEPDHGGRLGWIPWDLNEALRPATRPRCWPQSVTLDEYGTDWPLIRFLLDDPTYREAYRGELAALLAGAFSAEALDPKLIAAHDLVAPWVVGPEAVETAPYTFLPNRAALALVASACVLGTAPARAQVLRWTEVGASAEVAPGLRFGLDQEVRFESSNRIELVRPGLHASWRALRWLSLRLGYRYEVEPHYTKGEDYADGWHEAYLDVTLRRRIDRLRLSLRLRYEDKRGRPWDEDGALVHTRKARQKLEAGWPLGRTVSLVASGELFLKVRDPDGPRDKWRAGGGVAVERGAHEVALRVLREHPLTPGDEPANIVAVSYEFAP